MKCLAEALARQGDFYVLLLLKSLTYEMKIFVKMLFSDRNMCLLIYSCWWYY